MQTLPLTRDVVLVGGGHTHALVLRAWAMDPLAGARLTLIDPGPTAAYSGMLPGHIAGHYSRAELDIDLVRLARAAGARLVLGAACGIDRAARTVDVPGRPPLAYDILSLDIGITSRMPDLPGFAAHAVPAKPLGAFAARWQAFVDGSPPGPVVIIGAGIAGVELALAMAFRLRRAGVAAPSITLVDAGTPLSALNAQARRLLSARLDRAGIRLIADAHVTAIEAGAVRLAAGDPLPCAFCCGAAGAQPYPWLAETGLPLRDGFVRVDDTLRSTADPAIYAVGDCAHMDASPRPKAGVFAVRQAPVLAANLRADLTGAQRRRYRPQRDYLKLVSLGGKSALADRGPLAIAAPWLWRLKDRIDRDFMDRFATLPSMPAPPLPRAVAAGVRAELGSGAPLCGGCGAKVGPDGLAAALQDLPRTDRTDILSRPGDDAAILSLGGVHQVLTTDHLRSVVEDPWLMARITVLHAMGDIWAMGATPQAGLLNVILPRMRARMQAATLREITAAAAETLDGCGAALVGGHSTLGAELTIGVTLTGLAGARPVTLVGARPGDTLLLTRPIGTGVMLAAEMQGQAAGRDMAALYSRMTTPQTEAAALLAPLARAMTDVTGFGLAGHALAMATASGVTLELTPDAVPLWPGARALGGRPVRSSLFAQNRDSAWPRMTGFADTPDTDLLFDPQTCGGLLAAVPADAAAALVDRLRAANAPETAIIGRVADGPPGLTAI
jgi:selenide,water dikinase